MAMETALEPVEFNTQLAKELKKLKKDLGVTKVRQNYRGTGSKKAVRQLYISVPWQWRGLDLWLYKDCTALGGCIVPIKPQPVVKHEGKTPAQVYEEIKAELEAWKDSVEGGA